MSLDEQVKVLASPDLYVPEEKIWHRVILSKENLICYNNMRF